MTQAYVTEDFKRTFRCSELWVSVYERHCGHLPLSLDRHFVPVHLSRLGEDG